MFHEEKKIYEACRSYGAPDVTKIRAQRYALYPAILRHGPRNITRSAYNNTIANSGKLDVSALVCQCFPQFAIVCQSFPQFAIVCQSLPQFAKVCHSLLKQKHQVC